METKKIPRKIRIQLEKIESQKRTLADELRNTPTRLEELNKLVVGQRVIMDDDEIMKYIGLRTAFDSCSGHFVSDPVFLSEINLDGKISYKKIMLLTKCTPHAIYEEIITSQDKNYNQIKQRWENLK